MKKFSYLLLITFYLISSVKASTSFEQPEDHVIRLSYFNMTRNDLEKNLENSTNVSLYQINSREKNYEKAKKIYDEVFNEIYYSIEHRKFPSEGPTEDSSIRVGSHSSKLSFMHWLNKEQDRKYDYESWKNFKKAALGWEKGDSQISSEESQITAISKVFQVLMLANKLKIVDINNDININSILSEMGTLNVKEYCHNIISTQAYHNSNIVISMIYNSYNLITSKMDYFWE